MRIRWIVSSLLPVICLLVPSTVHADTIDDFDLTGGGYTITFSLPASPSTFVTTGAGGSIIGFEVNAEVDANGTEFNQELQFFNGRSGFIPAGLAFGNGIPDPNPGAGGRPLQITGAVLYSGTEAAPTFLTGTFDMQDFYGLAPTIPYTLTITPESTTSPVPEPSALMLLATGGSGLLGLARRRRLS